MNRYVFSWFYCKMREMKKTKHKITKWDVGKNEALSKSMRWRFETIIPIFENLLKQNSKLVTIETEKIFIIIRYKWPIAILSILLQSNENMDLMSQVQSEQHISKELASRLGHQEDELNDVRDKVKNFPFFSKFSKEHTENLEYIRSLMNGTFI